MCGRESVPASVKVEETPKGTAHQFSEMLQVAVDLVSSVPVIWGS